MNMMPKFFRSGVCLILSLAVASLLAGCQTTDSPAPGKPAGPGATAGNTGGGGETVFQVGELLKIDFSGTVVSELRSHEEHIKDDGTITLEYIGSIKAAGKTAGQLQTEIYTNYVPRFYRNLNVTVRGSDRFYYVGGEVKAAARQPYLGPITVTGAIKSAGDFTDFAKKRKVRLIRANSTKAIIVDCIKALEDPRLDLPVYPGDRIDVPRRIL